MSAIVGSNAAIYSVSAKELPSLDMSVTTINVRLRINLYLAVIIIQVQHIKCSKNDYNFIAVFNIIERAKGIITNEDVIKVYGVLGQPHHYLF